MSASRPKRRPSPRKKTGKVVLDWNRRCPRCGKKPTDARGAVGCCANGHFFSIRKAP